MNSNEQHPSLTFPIRKAELIVHPNSGFDVFESRFAELQQEAQDKFDDLEDRLNALIDSLGSAGLPTRKGMLHYTPSQFYQYQKAHGGYYEIPWDCYLETLAVEADPCMALWVNFPYEEGPEAYWRKRMTELKNENKWNSTNKNALYRELATYMISDFNPSYRYGMSTFLHKGDKLLLTAAWHHNFEPYNDNRTQNYEGDGFSFIRLLPIIR